MILQAFLNPAGCRETAQNLLFNRAVRRARVKKGYSSEGHGKRAESKEQEEHTGDKREVTGSKMLSGMPQNEPKRAQDTPKQGQGRPKTAPRGAQEGHKSEPKPQDEKRTEPRRSQDRLGSPCVGGYPQFGVTPGAPFGSPKRYQNGAENDQKSKRKIKRQKNRSKTILGPSWGDLGPSWVPSWGPGNALALRLPMFRENSLFRC